MGALLYCLIEIAEQAPFLLLDGYCPLYSEQNHLKHWDYEFSATA
jgi:hypothetical protein